MIDSKAARLPFSEARPVTATSARGVVVSGPGTPLEAAAVALLQGDRTVRRWRGVVDVREVGRLPGRVAAGGADEARGRVGLGEALPGGGGVGTFSGVGRAGLDWTSDLTSDWTKVQRFSLPATSEVSSRIWVSQQVALRFKKKKKKKKACWSNN